MTAVSQNHSADIWPQSICSQDVQQKSAAAAEGTRNSGMDDSLRGHGLVLTGLQSCSPFTFLLVSFNIGAVLSSRYSWEP